MRASLKPTACPFCYLLITLLGLGCLPKTTEPGVAVGASDAPPATGVDAPAVAGETPEPEPEPAGDDAPTADPLPAEEIPLDVLDALVAQVDTTQSCDREAATTSAITVVADGESTEVGINYARLPEALQALNPCALEEVVALGLEEKTFALVSYHVDDINAEAGFFNCASVELGGFVAELGCNRPYEPFRESLVLFGVGDNHCNPLSFDFRTMEKNGDFYARGTDFAQAFDEHVLVTYEGELDSEQRLHVRYEDLRLGTSKRNSDGQLEDATHPGDYNDIAFTLAFPPGFRFSVGDGTVSNCEGTVPACAAEEGGTWPNCGSCPEGQSPAEDGSGCVAEVPEPTVMIACGNQSFGPFEPAQILYGTDGDDTLVYKADGSYELNGQALPGSYLAIDLGKGHDLFVSENTASSNGITATTLQMGPGNDRIENSTFFGNCVDLNTGHNRVTNVNATASHFYAEDGDDFFNFAALTASFVIAGEGNDTLETTAFSHQFRFLAGGGHDVLNTYDRAWQFFFYAGPGQDVLNTYDRAWQFRFRGEAGEDTLNLGAGSSTFTFEGGKGDDRLNFYGYRVTAFDFEGGEHNDTLFMAPGSWVISLKYDGGDGFDTLIRQGTIDSSRINNVESLQ